jgi:radical SAM superfamily enzyme YgiQ (UPF0313 family)
MLPLTCTFASANQNEQKHSLNMLERMRDAGCKDIWFGVESGSPRILKKINRTITLEQTENAFRLCKQVGMHVACSFMLGFPHETREDLEATRKFADRLDPDWCQFNVFIAYPDSGFVPRDSAERRLRPLG